MIDPGIGRPTEPRSAGHSVPVMTVAACASVPAYSSKILSGPNQSIHTCFSHSGQGSARCHTARRDDMS